MKPLPTDPMQQHSRFIAAFCADIMAGECAEAPRAKAVVAVAKATNSQEPEVANNGLRSVSR